MELNGTETRTSKKGEWVVRSIESCCFSFS